MTTTTTVPAAVITSLRQQLIEDMNMRRFSRDTQRNWTPPRTSLFPRGCDSFGSVRARAVRCGDRRGSLTSMSA